MLPLDDSSCFAFVDESGQSDLAIEKQGASNLFICVAVILERDQIKQADQAMRELSNSQFSGSEVKSSNIGANHGRRVKILEYIRNIDFRYYCLVINKGRINKPSGLQHKKSFYKYLYRMLYERIGTPGRKTNILADEVGGEDFMDSFKPYFDSRIELPLFPLSPPNFAKSKDEPLIQLADIIAGTLSYCFDKEKRCEFSNRFRDMLREKEIGISAWPLLKEIVVNPESRTSSILDTCIFRANTTRAQAFIDQFEDDADVDRKMQVAVLTHLLFLGVYEQESNRFRCADDLIALIRDQGLNMPSEQVFRAKVIAPIRDEQIIITGNEKGYALALSNADISYYIRHANGIIIPMLARLKKADQAIKQITSNKHDILGTDEFRILKDILKTYTDWSAPLKLDRFGAKTYSSQFGL